MFKNFLSPKSHWLLPSSRTQQGQTCLALLHSWYWLLGYLSLAVTEHHEKRNSYAFTGACSFRGFKSAEQRHGGCNSLEFTSRSIITRQKESTLGRAQALKAIKLNLSEHLLQQGHTTQSFPNSYVNWRQNIQKYRLMEAILIQTDTGPIFTCEAQGESLRYSLLQAGYSHSWLYVVSVVPILEETKRRLGLQLKHLFKVTPRGGSVKFSSKEWTTWTLSLSLFF